MPTPMDDRISGVSGGGIKLTPNMNLFAEYTEWTVDGHATLGDFTVLEGPQFTLYWQY